MVRIPLCVISQKIGCDAKYKAPAADAHARQTAGALKTSVESERLQLPDRAARTASFRLSLDHYKGEQYAAPGSKINVQSYWIVKTSKTKSPMPLAEEDIGGIKNKHGLALPGSSAQLHCTNAYSLRA
jgi:hypothetical protein